MDDGRHDAMRELARFYRRNGYVRRRNADRLEAEGARQYKKGDEVRLSANSASELRLLRRLLREAGFEPGRPFQKGAQFRQPVYGRPEVARFLAAVDSVPERSSSAATPRAGKRRGREAGSGSA